MARGSRVEAAEARWPCSAEAMRARRSASWRPDMRMPPDTTRTSLKVRLQARQSLARALRKYRKEACMKRFIAASCFLFLITACGPGAENPPGGEAGGELKLAFVTNNTADFWAIARRGVEKADEEMPDV